MGFVGSEGGAGGQGREDDAKLTCKVVANLFAQLCTGFVNRRLHLRGERVAVVSRHNGDLLGRAAVLSAQRKCRRVAIARLPERLFLRHRMRQLAVHRRTCGMARIWEGIGVCDKTNASSAGQ